MSFPFLVGLSKGPTSLFQMITLVQPHNMTQIFDLINYRPCEQIRKVKFELD